MLNDEFQMFDVLRRQSSNSDDYPQVDAFVGQ